MSNNTDQKDEQAEGDVQVTQNEATLDKDVVAATPSEETPKDAQDQSSEDQPDTEQTEGDANEDGAGETSEDLDTDIWGDAQDDVANSVLLTLQNSGVTPDEAKALLWDAFQENDPTKIDRDALVEKVGKSNATLVMAGIENVTTRRAADELAAAKTVHDAAGGKANWDKVAPWARENVPEKDLAEYRDMIDKGGKQAEFAAAELVKAYNADTKNTTIGKKTRMEGDTPTTPKIEGLSRRAYGDALLKLQRTGATAEQLAELRARRAAGKAQGL